MTAATSLSLAARRAQVRVATRATVVTSRRLGVATFAKNATDGSERRRQRVCVLGGGFGGLYTALRLKSLRWPASAAEVDRVAKRGEDMLAASAALRPPQQTLYFYPLTRGTPPPREGAPILLSGF